MKLTIEQTNILGLTLMVLPDGLEPPTSALQVRRTTNCAKEAGAGYGSSVRLERGHLTVYPTGTRGTQTKQQKLTLPEPRPRTCILSCIPSLKSRFKQTNNHFLQ